MALRATVYLSLLGRAGLEEVSELCLRKAHYAAKQITAIPGLSLAFDQPFFKEFAVRSQRPAAEILTQARQAGFDLGPDLARFDDAEIPESIFLVAVTEQRTREEIDGLVASLRDSGE